MFGWEFPPYNSGGLGVACLGLTRALSRLGMEVSFVLPKRLGKYDMSNTQIVFADDFYQKLGISGITFHEVDSLLYPYVDSDAYMTGLSASRGPVPYASTLMQEVRRYARIAKTIAQEESFDIIHAHDWLSFEAGIVAKQISGKPLIVHVHATEFDRCAGDHINQEVYDIELRGMNEADRIVAVSQWTKNVIVSRYGISPDKVSVVHNGVDETDFIRPQTMPHEILSLKSAGNKIVLFVGRITIQKGPDYFVKMARTVLEHYKDVYFVVSGSGDMERQMIEQVATSGMSDRFIFTGFLRGEELNQIYAAADLYVMPSVSEPFGLTPLEANLSGAPALVSKQTGSGEIMTHTLKCDFWDTDEMANQVISVLQHPELYRALKENSFSQARTNSWQKAAQKLIGVYKTMTA